MARRITAVLVSCCCLMLAESAMAKPEHPSKPARADKPVQDPATPQVTATPKPANRLNPLKSGKPKASNAATKPVAFPGPDLGLGCAKDE